MIVTSMRRGVLGGVRRGRVTAAGSASTTERGSSSNNNGSWTAPSFSTRSFSASPRPVFPRTMPLPPFSEGKTEAPTASEGESKAEPLHQSDKPLPVNFGDVSRAMYRIREGIIRTSCRHSHFLSERCKAHIWLKEEFRQFTGSFKERGARNALLSLSPEEASRGVIAASAGNHAQALAWHGAKMGIKVTVIMPKIAPLTKILKCRKFGANVVIHGAHIGEAKAHALLDPEFEGMRYVNGYDDPEIIAGAGTMGIEMLEQIAEKSTTKVDYVVVPIGGAGLIAGVSLAVKSLDPSIKVIGVEPKFCASYSAALKAGKPIHAETTPTLADGLAVPEVGPTAFEVARHYVDDVVQVSEKEVALSVLRLIEHERVMVEGGGAVGLAALLPGAPLDIPEMKGKNIVVPLCGGNIDIPVLHRVLDRGLAADHRLVRFATNVSDRPGGIKELAKALYDAGASIRDIYHERAWLHTHVDQVQIKCVIETVDKDHMDQVHDHLTSAGYSLIWGRDASDLW